MTPKPSFDLDAAHRHFSTACFNQVWGLLDKKDRSSDDGRMMIAAAMASVYHWQQRPDCTAQQLSVGYWQVSRVHAMLGRGVEELHYAELCESYSQQLAVFYRGYALEAVARAASLVQQNARSTQAKQKALELLSLITETEERELLAQDLAGL